MPAHYPQAQERGAEGRLLVDAFSARFCVLACSASAVGRRRRDLAQQLRRDYCSALSLVTRAFAFCCIR